MDSEDSSDGGEGDEPFGPADRIDLDWLFVGKRAGLSFAEMNEMRIRDLIAYVDRSTGGASQESRKATAADIDRFYGG